MKITTDDETLRVSDLRELGEPEAGGLIRDLRTALTPAHSTVEFDLAHLRSADCDTIDALLAVYEEFDRGGGPARVWRVTNPPPDLRQLFELVRLHHLFEITPPRPARLIAL